MVAYALAVPATLMQVLATPSSTHESLMQSTVPDLKKYAELYWLVNDPRVVNDAGYMKIPVVMTSTVIAVT
jgi:hypothetical protein